MSRYLSRISPLRLAKTAFGGLLACAIAVALGLSYSTSAGVITILSLQNTRRETLALVARRIGAFFLAVLFAFVSFSLLGYQLAGMGLFLLLFAAACQLLGLGEALVMNTVLVFHFYAEQSMSLFWLRNEILLLLVGAGVGILLNLYMPGNAGAIRQNQARLEDAFRTILQRMADQLLTRDKTDYRDGCFAPLSALLDQMASQAYENRNNTLLTDTRYFIRYVEMRRRQQKVLRRLYDNIHRMDQVPEQACAIAAFLEQISRSFHEHNNAEGLLRELHRLMEQMRQQPLPQTRAEFENRAFLYRTLYDLEDFLQLKADFAAALTPEEKARFWQDGETR